MAPTFILRFTSYFWYLLGSVHITDLLFEDLHFPFCVFQPHVHGDERSAEDERRYCYKCHVGII